MPGNIAHLNGKFCRKVGKLFWLGSGNGIRRDLLSGTSWKARSKPVWHSIESRCSCYSLRCRQCMEGRLTCYRETKFQ